ALKALDRGLEAAGPESVSAYFCEPISAAALPAYTPPKRFWEGLAERREKHGFLICLDEIVTGIGRTGHWFAAGDLPLVPDSTGHSYLLCIEYVDPRDHKSFLPPELRTAGRVDDIAFEHGLITYSTMPTRDGFAGDQTLFAPPFTSTDAELAEMVERYAEALRQVAKELESKLEARPVA